MLYQKNKAFVSINFIPFIKDNYYEWFNSRKEMLGDRTIYEFLVTILNEKLVNTILYVTNISKDKIVNELNSNEIDNIISNLTSFKLEIISSKETVGLLKIDSDISIEKETAGENEKK